MTDPPGYDSAFPITSFRGSWWCASIWTQARIRAPLLGVPDYVWEAVHGTSPARMHMRVQTGGARYVIAIFEEHQ